MHGITASVADTSSAQRTLSKVGRQALVILLLCCAAAAHGAELVSTTLPAAYAAGFVVSTGLLHLAGISFGALKGVRYGAQLVRVTGAAIAVAGVWILAGMPGMA